MPEVLHQLLLETATMSKHPEAFELILGIQSFSLQARDPIVCRCPGCCSSSRISYGHASACLQKIHTSFAASLLSDTSVSAQGHKPWLWVCTPFRWG